MSRDDSALFTGLSSASFRKQEAQRTLELQKRKAVKAVLKPTEEFITDEIAKQEQRVKETLANLPVTFETKQEDIKSFLLAQQMNLAFIHDFKTALLNRLRMPEESNE